MDDEVLTTIEAAVRSVTMPPVMIGDRWLLASCLQKSIRRGETMIAASAARSLWSVDRQSFYRRVLVIALEDVGVAAISEIIVVLIVCAATAWRKRVGDLEAGLFAVSLLCAATKTRLSEQMLTTAEKARDLAEARLELGLASDQQLADAVLDDSMSLPERSVALWLAAGTRRFPSERLPIRHGSDMLVLELLNDLDAPADLVRSCIPLLYRTEWALCLFTPLLAAALAKMPTPILTRHDELYPPELYEGIPLVALDQYTRTGKAAIRELRQTVPELQSFTTTQIGLAVFYEEGARLDKPLTSDILEEYRCGGEVADIETAGLTMPCHLGLKDIIRHHGDLLNDIRKRELRRYLRDQQADLFGAA